MARCVFQNSFSDAIDIDFGIGELHEVQIITSGNDAIDLSGASVKMSGIRIYEAGDKGISVGEQARTTIRDLQIEVAQIGMAAKDLSQLTADNLKLRACEIGLAVYQKKPEFGAGEMQISNWDTAAIRKPFMVEAGSACRVDGKQIPAVEKGVRNQLENE